MRRPGASWEDWKPHDTLPDAAVASRARAPKRGWLENAPDGWRYAPHGQYRWSGKSAAINGATLILASSQLIPFGHIPVVTRIWMIFGTASTGDDGTDNTTVAFRVSDSGVLGTYTTLGTLSTSAEPGAGATVEAAVNFPLDPQKVIHVLVTRNAAGVDHNNDVACFGVDVVARIVAPDQQGVA